MPPLNEKIVVTPIIKTKIETDVAKIETDVGVNFFEISKDLYLSQFQSKKNLEKLYPTHEKIVMIPFFQELKLD